MGAIWTHARQFVMRKHAGFTWQDVQKYLEGPHDTAYGSIDDRHQFVVRETNVYRRAFMRSFLQEGRDICGHSREGFIDRSRSPVTVATRLRVGPAFCVYYFDKIPNCAPCQLPELPIRVRKGSDAHEIGRWPTGRQSGWFNSSGRASAVRCARRR